MRNRILHWLAALLSCWLTAAAFAVEPSNGHPALVEVERGTEAMRVDPESTRAHAEAALAMLARQPDADLEIRTRLLLCDYYSEQNPALAQEQITRAFAVLPNAKRQALRAGIVNCQGDMFETAGDNVRAKALYEEAVQIATESGDEEMLAAGLRSRGFLRGLQGNYAAGLADLRRAQSTYERIGFDNHALTLMNDVAILYNRLGDFSQAQHIYRRALKAQRDAKMRREEAVTLYNLGRTHENLGEWKSARATFSESRNISRELGYARGEGYALRGLASVANAMGNADGALAILSEAAARQRETSDARLEAHIHLARGIALRQLGQLQDALRELNPAVRFFEQAESLRELAQARAELATVRARMGDWRTAFQEQAASRDVESKLLNNQLDQRFAALKIEFDTLAKEKENVLLTRENEAKEIALEHERSARQWQAAVILLSAVLLVLLATLALRQRQNNKRMHVLAMTDELTGIPNRRAVLSRLEPLLVDADQLPCSMLIIDIDHFKSINDHHGHPAGDDAIKRVTAKLKGELPGNAFMGRLGGEEFVIVLPQTDLAKATRLADEFREQIALIDTSSWLDGRRITVSIGVATADAASETTTTMLKRADAALYAAKRGGRNCVRVQMADTDNAADAGEQLNFA